MPASSLSSSVPLDLAGRIGLIEYMSLTTLTIWDVDLCGPHPATINACDNDSQPRTTRESRTSNYSQFFGEQIGLLTWEGVGTVRVRLFRIRHIEELPTDGQLLQYWEHTGLYLI